MEKRGYLFLICLLFYVYGANAHSFPSQLWHSGKVYLADGEIMEGMIKYDLENNLVKVQKKTVKTFSAVSVHHFEIFDQQLGGVRVFYSLPYSSHSEYKVPTFFELLFEGEDMTLLCREYITIDARGMNNMAWAGMHMGPMWGPPIPGQNRLAFNFYFLTGQQILAFNQKKRDLLELMDDKSPEIRLFMRKYGLSQDRRGDLLRITAYYNHLKQDA